MEKVTLKYFNENLHNIFNLDNPKAYYCVHEQTEVNTGMQDDCDMQYCKEHNIPVYLMERSGGTIVCSKGNIGISVITPVKWGWQTTAFLNAFTEYLKSKNLNVEYNNNDILVDGFKVASSAEIRVGDNLKNVYSTYQISINQDIEAIEHICKKEMIKIPKGLKDYGIITSQIVNWCENYFDNLIIKK